MWYFTSTYYMIKAMKTKIKIIQGGQGAGKNISIAQILIEEALKSKTGLVITVMSDTYDNLRDGAIKDFADLFEAAEMDWQKAYNKNASEARIFRSVVQFRYISDIHKNSGKSKRRDILYINEANKVGWEVASTYIGRTHGDVYIDYNPDNEFWTDTEVPKLKDNRGKDLSSKIIVTYVHNEMLPESERNYILSRKDNESWFRVYGLGLTGYYSDRRILNYSFVDSIPDDAVRMPSGMDFGISPDPTWLGNIYLRRNEMYVDELFCLNNLMPEKINGAERMSIVDQLDLIGFEKGWKIIADNAGRNEILDIRKHGYNIVGVIKHPGDIIRGLNILRSYDIFLTKNSIALKKGIESYFWKLDKNGKIIPEPDGHEPDGVAAIRYVAMTCFGKKRPGITRRN